MAQVAANGGDIARVALPTPTMTPLSVSPDGSTLLVADEVGQTAFHGPLWSVPVLGGSARKLGDIDTPSAGFSPDGQTIAYVSGNDLFLAKSDGSQSRKLVSLSDAVFDPLWSPDAKSIRFRLGGGFNSVGSLWEVGVDGTNPHALLPGWHSTASECCGQWTPDANYFVFQSGSNVWSRAEKKTWFGKAISQPVQLTSGPLGYFSPLLSKDGKKLSGLRP
jgi:Tol biopolymer transport system component